MQGVVIEVPPLAAGPADIPLLSQRFLDRVATRVGLEFDGDAVGALMAHGWAANVRKLKHVVERGAARDGPEQSTRMCNWHCQVALRSDV